MVEIVIAVEPLLVTVLVKLAVRPTTISPKRKLRGLNVSGVLAKAL